MAAPNELEEDMDNEVRDTLAHLGRKFMSCNYCQELCQQASWFLINYTRVNNQSEARTAS